MGDLPDREIKNLLSRIASADALELIAIWRGRDDAEWRRHPEIYRLVGERILAQGEPLLAYDVMADGLSIWPSDVRLRQLQGLALARSGATERASALLEQLRSEGVGDEETLGMLGRTYKDLGGASAEPLKRREFLRRAAEIYSQAYENSRGYWSGINAATMSLLIGEKERACQLANQVREQCLRELQDRRGNRYWELAALGEAALVCGEWSAAGEWYARAAEEGKKRFGDLHSSRRNARLLLDHWQKDFSWIEQYLHIPPVIVFVGHMIDRPGRGAPRFPPELERAVAGKIKESIAKLNPGFGFSSAACGSDILFLEAMLEHGAEASVVLPYNRGEFIPDSVEFVPGSDWRLRFERVLERANPVLTASKQRLEIGGVSYEFCNRMLLGLASIRARQLDTDLIPLAVWNGRSGDGPGGAAAVVQEWRDLGYNPEIIDLPVEDVRARSEIANVAENLPNQSEKAPTPPTHSQGPDFRSRIVAMLFADAVGFSKLSEREVPRFVQHFLGAIARLSEKFNQTILARNTWGDGIYFVFSDVKAAGQFGLELAGLVARTNWEEKELPAGLNLRIGLHAGPVYEFDDPITGQRTYSGTHVSRAARIEPITPPGQVYGSEAFAALAAADRAGNFSCDYVGETPMAKGYGSFPTYHVRPTSAAPDRVKG